jgi:hypothetical protein
MGAAGLPKLADQGAATRRRDRRAAKRDGRARDVDGIARRPVGVEAGQDLENPRRGPGNRVIKTVEDCPRRWLDERDGNVT